MVTKLKKAPRVVDALKQGNKVTGYGADGGDIFDDFGGPSTKAKVEEVAEMVQLDIDHTALLL